MYIAQWPDGTWILYKDKPRLKMTGWDGEQLEVLHNRELWIISWRETCRKVDPKEFGYEGET